MLQIPGEFSLELPVNKAWTYSLRPHSHPPHKQERWLHRLPEINVRQQQEHALQLGWDHSIDKIDLRGDVKLTLRLLLQI